MPMNEGSQNYSGHSLFERAMIGNQNKGRLIKIGRITAK